MSIIELDFQRPRVALSSPGGETLDENEPETSAVPVVEDIDDAVNVVEGLPLRLLELYADVASRHAVVEEVDPGVWIAKVAGLRGAYGEGDEPGEALTDLQKTIISWVVVKRRRGATDIPLMEGLDLNPIGRSNIGETPATDETA